MENAMTEALTTKMLTDAERARLAELEGVISTGLQTFVEVGTALLEIRETGLYAESSSSFEDYCQEKWGMTRRRASQLIEGAEIYLQIGCENAEHRNHGSDVAIKKGVNSAVQPTNERQVRPLSRLPEGERQEAWNEAVEAANG
jgi:hypothetical protein